MDDIPKDACQEPRWGGSRRRLYSIILVLFCTLEVAILNRLHLEYFNVNAIELELDFRSETRTVTIAEGLTSIFICLILAFCITRIKVNILMIFGMILLGVTCLSSQAAPSFEDGTSYYHFSLGTHIAKGIGYALTRVSLLSVALSLYPKTDGIVTAVLLCLDVLGNSCVIIIVAFMEEPNHIIGINIIGCATLATCPLLWFMIFRHAPSGESSKAPKPQKDKLFLLYFLIGLVSTLSVYVFVGFRRIVVNERFLGSLLPFKDYSALILDTFSLIAVLPFMVFAIIFGVLWVKGSHPAYSMLAAILMSLLGVGLIAPMPYVENTQFIELMFCGLVFTGIGEATLVPFLHLIKICLVHKDISSSVSFVGVGSSLVIAIQVSSQLLDYVVRFSFWQIHVGNMSVGLLCSSVFSGLILIILTLLTRLQVKLPCGPQDSVDEGVELQDLSANA